MKILYVITGLGMGGAEHVVVNLADTLDRQGCFVKIIYLTGDALVLPTSDNIDILPIEMKSYFDFIRAYFKIRLIVRSFEPDVIHSHMFHANIISRLLRLTTGVKKLICTAHNTNEGGRLRMLAYRLTDKLSTISTNVSDQAVASFIKKGAVRKDRMISIANGIDTDVFCFNSNDREEKRSELDIENKKLLLAVGRLDTQKDYPNLLRAISILSRKRDDFKVFIVGEGPSKTKLHEQVIKLGLDDSIAFLGLRRDVRKLMSAADIYVMSSAWEGLPMVILEAMASELFIVSTDCGGVRQAVGEAGIIVESKNSTLLAAELDKALSMSNDSRKKFGAAARQRIVNGFSLKNNVESFFKLYRD